MPSGRDAGGMPVQLGAQLVDDGDRLVQRSPRLFPQFLRRPRFVEPRLDGGRAFLEAADDVPQA